MAGGITVFALLIVPPLHARTAGTSPDSFIRALYALFLVHNEQQDPLEGSERDRYLDPDLLAVWDRYVHIHANNGPGITIGLCDCQEGPTTNLQVRSLGTSKGAEVVEARFAAGGTPKVLRYILNNGSTRGWLIADQQDWIDPSHPWSIRRGLILAAESERASFDPAASVGRWAGADCRRDWTDWTWDGESVRFASPAGKVDVERRISGLPAGFVTETTSGTNTKAGVRWEYHFAPQDVRILNQSTGRRFVLKPCATLEDAALNPPPTR